MINENLVEKIKSIFPNKAIDLYSSLELVQTVLSEIINEIGLKASKNINERNFEEVNSLASIAESLYKYEQNILNVLSILEIESAADNSDGNKMLPEYEKYTVDTNIEHSLYENFTHVRPYGFKINDKKVVEVTSWQQMLIKTCEIFLKLDKERLLGFENLEHMNGKKNKYFSVTNSVLRKPGSVNDEIYIELNQSSNSVRNLIIKMLKEFGFKISDFKVYFRADYTNLKEEN
ncbi:hypothetical protein [Fusibacter tunisiensis]|uniref:Uncharacterized protein n=1 Tax=Fusibacter tunisiensis TaxID=1008308 RepID=A0ABS2MSV2_9FIRM|nr:hypothetical protein [Fusibacter tunisiensis]MBM7562511.1 hypothetical protein [Fusibacter tunisiensis]